MIITVGVLGALAFIFQLIHLVLVRLAVSRQLKHLDRPSANNPLGRVLLAFKGDKSKIEEDADVAELRITEAVLREVPKLERFQAFLRLCVAAGPLLGLIGTVVGMILTFQSITESGSSDPKLMATGIGQAMIATVLGLGIAIPLLFAGALLNSLSKARCPDPRRAERRHAGGEHREATPCLSNCRSSGASRRSSNDGGPFVLCIFSAGVLMWALIIERYWYFSRILPKQVAELQASGRPARTARRGVRGRSARR